MLSRNDVPRGRIARDLWGELPSRVRRDVIHEAGSGRPYADPRIAAIAVGWAWEVLGRPEARRNVGIVKQLSGLLLSAPVGAGDVAGSDIYDGETWHDESPVVRRAARNVEAANPLQVAEGDSVDDLGAPGRTVPCGRGKTSQMMYWILLVVAALLVFFAVRIPQHRVEYLVIGVGSGVLAGYEICRARLGRRGR
jgi:hypothetical protein